MAVEFDENTVRPGDVLVLDYEILTQNATLEAAAIKRIKEEVWSHPKLDFQSTKIMVVGDQELGRDVKLLRIWAIVRKTDKATRLAVQEASIGTWIVVAAGFVVGVATAIVLRDAAKYLGAAKETAEETAKEVVNYFALAVAALALLWLVTKSK